MNTDAKHCDLVVDIAKSLSKPSDSVKSAADGAKDFLGDGFQVKRNDNKAFVAMSADGNKRFRSDIGGHGDKPHAHLEIKNEHGYFKGATSEHRLYFKEDP